MVAATHLSVLDIESALGEFGECPMVESHYSVAIGKHAFAMCYEDDRHLVVEMGDRIEYGFLGIRV